MLISILPILRKLQKLGSEVKTRTINAQRQEG